jgi:hypothetical protein
MVLRSVSTNLTIVAEISVDFGVQHGKAELEVSILCGQSLEVALDSAQGRHDSLWIHMDETKVQNSMQMVSGRFKTQDQLTEK